MARGEWAGEIRPEGTSDAIVRELKSVLVFSLLRRVRVEETHPGRRGRSRALPRRK